MRLFVQSEPLVVFCKALKGTGHTAPNPRPQACAAPPDCPPKLREYSRPTGGSVVGAVNELSDGVVTLRALTPTDAEVHLAGEDEPTVRFLSGGRSTMATVLAWIERNRLSREASGPVRSFGICLAATGTLVGVVEANLATPGFRPGVANISYGLYPGARGHGYATRAVELMTRHLVDCTAAAIAAIQVHPENPASARLPGRLSFRFLGERVTAEGERMLTYAKALRQPAELRLADVCQP